MPSNQRIGHDLPDTSLFYIHPTWHLLQSNGDGKSLRCFVSFALHSHGCGFAASFLFREILSKWLRMHQATAPGAMQQFLDMESVSGQNCSPLLYFNNRQRPVPCSQKYGVLA